MKIKNKNEEEADHNDMTP